MSTLHRLLLRCLTHLPSNSRKANNRLNQARQPNQAHLNHHNHHNSNPESQRRLVSMIEVLCVGAGGFVGTICRYLIGIVFASHLYNGIFPLSTLCINLAGSFLIGLFSVCIPALTPKIRAHSYFSLPVYSVDLPRSQHSPLNRSVFLNRENLAWR